MFENIIERIQNMKHEIRKFKKKSKTMRDFEDDDTLF